MVVSSWLQKYFDSQQKKKSKRQLQDTFHDLKEKIHPRFFQSFQEFQTKLMAIVEDDPDNSDIVAEEVVSLWQEMQKLQRSHDSEKLKKVTELA